MNSRILTAIAISFVTSGAAVASTPDEFAYCLVCHGANGNGNTAIHAPKVSGLEPWYLARQLESFAAGHRGVVAEDAPGHEMGPIGKRLKQEGRIDAAVKFVGTLQSQPPAATITGDVQRGKQLYATCAACHGTAGEGNAKLQAPALAQRTDWYLVKQLGNYRQGLRGADPRDSYGTQMRTIAASLPDDKAMTDVVAFINTLK